MTLFKEFQSALKGLWSLAVGLKVTGREFARPQLTVHYPRKVVDNIVTYRGHIELVGKPKEPAVPKCITCMMCATVCPSGCISIKKFPPPKVAPAAEGEEAKPKAKPVKTPKAFNLNYNTCSLCGLCVQNCPVDSLRFSTDVYLAGVSRADFEYDLMARLAAQAEAVAKAKAPAEATAGAKPGEGGE